MENTLSDKEHWSKVEHIKFDSNGLRGPVDVELENGLDHFTEEGYWVLKFHGIYQQDDRDIRKIRKAEGLGPDYSFMLRVAIAGGVLTPEQYLAMDQLADELGVGSLRLTTRQAIQYHGVRKGGLKPLIASLNKNLLTTLNGCGDVVRNICSCPAPHQQDGHKEVMDYALQLSQKVKPKSNAFAELWLDGEKAVTFEDEQDDLYGTNYLPKKFKIGFAFPGDNCVDAYTQDVGVVPVLKDGRLEGFTLIVGGGFGQKNGFKATRAILGKPLTTIPKEKFFETVMAIVAVQRDNGNRADRNYARMKYLVEAWGVEKFRGEVEKVLGFALPQAEPVQFNSIVDHYGWHEQGDGKIFLGLFIENGRVTNKLKEGLKTLVEKFRPGVRITPQQHMLLTDINPGDKAAVEAHLASYEIALPEAYSQTIKQSMACPALPTCSLAITEAERVMPEVIRKIDGVLQELNVTSSPVVRMTGCPNGCARPYTAEIGLVGKSLNMYTMYLGASHLGDRLGFIYKDNVKRDQITEVLKPVYALYHEEKVAGEQFGDFCDRVGLEGLETKLNIPA